MSGTEVSFDTAEFETAKFDGQEEHLRLGCGL
jgi:hypothetical protein